jgi:hypothetical protein
MAGAPIGNSNAAKGKRWSDAIDRALAKRCKGDGIAALDDLAEKLLAKADEGDMQALKELGDRIEGKPSQAIDLDAKVQGSLQIEKIERVIVDPKA